MYTSETLNIIKESFELWYNLNIAEDSPVSMAINYSDLQTLPIKAYHKVSLEMKALGVSNGMVYTLPIVSLTENYNHGITTEEEAKDNIIKKMLVALYGYSK